jgi:hypothetical protein
MDDDRGRTGRTFTVSYIILWGVSVTGSCEFRGSDGTGSDGTAATGQTELAPTQMPTSEKANSLVGDWVSCRRISLVDAFPSGLV